MEAILRYIYTGETHVSEENLQSFLQTANLLQIIGLSQNEDKPDTWKWNKSHVTKRQRSELESDEKHRWKNSKSFSSFEASEDETRGRKQSAESDGEAPETGKRSADERKKLWAGSKRSPLKKRSVSDNLSDGDEELTPVDVSQVFLLSNCYY